MSHIVTKTQSDSAALLHGFKNTKHLSWDDRKALSEKRQQLKKEQKELERREKEIKDEERKRDGKVKSRCKFCPFDHDSSKHPEHARSLPSISSRLSHAKTWSPDEIPDDHQYEEAILRAITETSKGNPEEDAIIERALRASLRELHNANGGVQDDLAFKTAMRASIREFQRAQAERPQETGVVSVAGEKHNADDDDDDHAQVLERVLTKSLEEYRAAQAAQPNSQPESVEYLDYSDSGIDTEYDEDFKRAVKESKRLHTENEQKRNDLAEREAMLVTNGHEAVSSGSAEAHDDDDEELKRALTASEQEEKLRQDELTQQRTEEQIVLDYIKKQSLLEEEMRKQREAQNGPPA